MFSHYQEQKADIAEVENLREGQEAEKASEEQAEAEAGSHTNSSERRSLPCCAHTNFSSQV